MNPKTLAITAIVALLLPALLCHAGTKNTITFDNQSGQPALVKLGGPTMRDVEVLVGQKRTVTASGGRYHIKTRYGTPGKYRYTKGDEFVVKDSATSRSEITITLHKVVDGNYDTDPISESEFLADKHPTGEKHPSDEQYEARVEAARQKAEAMGKNAIPVSLDDKGRLLVLGKGTKFNGNVGSFTMTLTVSKSGFNLASPSDLRHSDGDLVVNVGEAAITFSEFSLDTGEFAIAKDGQFLKQKDKLHLPPLGPPTNGSPAVDSTFAGWIERPDILWTGRLSIPKPIKFTYAKRGGKQICDGWKGKAPPLGEVTASGSLTDGDGATVAVFEKEAVRLLKPDRVFFECESGDWRVRVYPVITGAETIVSRRRDRTTPSEKAEQER